MNRGFTLIEVMIAMAIIGLTAVVLLDQRTDIVRDAGRARNSRTAWVLASQKIAELELDKTLWLGDSGQSNGDFRDIGDGYDGYTWEYQIQKQVIEVSDPLEQQKEEKPRELLRLTLLVRPPGDQDPVVIEAQFLIDVPQPAPAEEPKPPPPADGAAPAPGGATPAPGAPK